MVPTSTAVPLQVIGMQPETGKVVYLRTALLLEDKYLSFNTACPTLVLSLVCYQAAPSLAVYLLTAHITYTSQPPFILVRTHDCYGPYPRVYLELLTYAPS